MRLALRRRALRIDVGAEIAAVEPQVLPDLDDGKAIARAGARVLIDPGQGDVQVAGRLVYGEEVVLHDVAVVIVQTDIRGHGGGTAFIVSTPSAPGSKSGGLDLRDERRARWHEGAGPASCGTNKPAAAEATTKARSDPSTSRCCWDTQPSLRGETPPSHRRGAPDAACPGGDECGRLHVGARVEG